MLRLSGRRVQRYEVVSGHDIPMNPETGAHGPVEGPEGTDKALHFTNPLTNTSAASASSSCVSV